MVAILLWVCLLLVTGASARVVSAQPADAFIAYVRTANCFSEADTDCALQLGLFYPATGTETIISFPGVAIAPDTLQRLDDGHLLFQYTPAGADLTPVTVRLELESQCIEVIDLAGPDEVATVVSAAPDGQMLAYSLQSNAQPRAHDLTVLDLNEDVSYRLLSEAWTPLPTVFSPAADALAVMAAPLDADALATPFDVLVVALPGGDSVNLTPGPWTGGAPDWSAAGDRIAFVVHDPESDLSAIATATAVGADLVVFEPWSAYVWRPMWALGDQAIIYGESLEDSVRLWQLDPASGARTPLLEDQRLLSLSVSLDGSQLAYTRRGALSGPTVLCIVDLVASADACYDTIQPDENSPLVWGGWGGAVMGDEGREYLPNCGRAQRI